MAIRDQEAAPEAAGFIDIHCHLLAGIDDGAESFEVSVAMCRMAAGDGITDLVATPHCNDQYQFQPKLNQKKIEELQAAIGDTPKLLRGCDFHLSYENIRELIDRRKDFAINQTNYVLVEFGNQFIPEHFDRIFYEIEIAGLTPILTHPERNSVMRNKPELLYHWVSGGCLVQVTAQSYLGGFGQRAQHLVDMWLDRNLIHFFASDAHDTDHRPPLLSPCYEKLVEMKGREIADLLLKKNPQAVIRGLSLPPGPRPVAPKQTKRRRRNWFSFFLGH